MDFENLILEEREPGLWLLTVHRPAALNALNRATLAELALAVRAIRERADARVLLVTGSGEKAFVAGADIRELAALTPMEAQAMAELASDTFRGLERLSIPTVALVNGFALGGGCELAMSCDILLASDRAVFGQPEINIGIMPGFGGTQRLLRLVGRSRALELIMTGRQVKAEEARAIGLVNYVHPPAELLERGLELGRTLVTKPPLSIKLIKQMVQHGLDMNLSGATLWETDGFGLAFATDDRREGMAAFLEKRPPRFTGH
ncbi:MAG: enoyl-CoA hydratase/isomerase family protein [Burkholderiales bacterium]|nr:enoyl-CoA hydratase/isomerase family protein [Burkholderiales bacterium]